MKRMLNKITISMNKNAQNNGYHTLIAKMKACVQIYAAHFISKFQEKYLKFFTKDYFLNTL